MPTNVTEWWIYLHNSANLNPLSAAAAQIINLLHVLHPKWSIWIKLFRYLNAASCKIIYTFAPRFLTTVHRIYLILSANFITLWLSYMYFSYSNAITHHLLCKWHCNYKYLIFHPIALSIPIVRYSGDSAESTICVNLENVFGTLLRLGIFKKIALLPFWVRFRTRL